MRIDAIGEGGAVAYHPLLLCCSLDFYYIPSCSANFVPSVVRTFEVRTFCRCLPVLFVGLDASLRIVIPGADFALRWEGAADFVVAEPLAVEASERFLAVRPRVERAPFPQVQ